MNYNQALSWIDGFSQHGIKLGLDRIKQILSTLKDPQKQIRCVHVAGTNGKGSVCRFISSILAHEGYHTGLYLSPHLIDFRERFQIDDQVISKKQLTRIVEDIKPVVEQFCKEHNPPTYFEICTIIAFQFFSQQQVDYAVIEVGLGGRYDATNVITPLVSVITSVSLDHQHHLGNSLSEIATEKAGIIKNHIPVVTTAKDEALNVITSIADQKQSPITAITDEMMTVHSATSQQQCLTVRGIFDTYEITTKQTGFFQQENIAVSIAAIEILQQQGIYISKESIEQGIKKMHHPGRMQIIHQIPTMVIDGAHNPDAVKKSLSSIRSLFSYQRLIIIFGVMKDKAIDEMLDLLVSHADILILTQSAQDRAASTDDLFQRIQNLKQNAQIFETVTVVQAYHDALEIADRKDLIFATGSLFTIAEILQITTEK